MTFVVNPLGNGFVRTVNWAGFHAALVLAAISYWLRDRGPDRWRFAAWASLSALAVAAGWRFFPRYFFQLLPVLTLAAARGIVLLGKKRILVLALLLIPLIRFAPRYVLLATGHSAGWVDIAMDQDSRAAARQVRTLSHPGDSLFVWGFRPELYVYTGLPSANRFLDSQPLTGVPADRHLTQSQPVAPALAEVNRTELIRSRPMFIIDGLSTYNPKLAMQSYPELRPWLENYEVITRSPFAVIYRRK